MGFLQNPDVWKTENGDYREMQPVPKEDLESINEELSGGPLNPKGCTEALMELPKNFCNFLTSKNDKMEIHTEKDKEIAELKVQIGWDSCFCMSVTIFLVLLIIGIINTGSSSSTTVTPSPSSV
eukprot:767165-Hanusia_phi.AAC.3